MKNNLFCFILVLMSFTIACDKSEIQKAALKIEARDHCIDDCDECPPDDCCCTVELLSGGPTTLHFCGTTGPCLSTMVCGAASLGNCPDISGFRESITLLNTSDRDLFCAAKNAPFGISVASGTPTIRITCQTGQTNPQSVTITLNTPPDKPFWSTGNDCSLTNCFN
jgi:hypothetical protein